MFATRFQEIRKKLRFSKKFLSEASGVSRSSILKIETGECSPKVSTLNLLAQAMGVPTKLFFEKGDNFSNHFKSLSDENKETA